MAAAALVTGLTAFTWDMVPNTKCTGHSLGPAIANVTVEQCKDWCLKSTDCAGIDFQYQLSGQDAPGTCWYKGVCHFADLETSSNVNHYSALTWTNEVIPTEYGDVNFVAADRCAFPEGQVWQETVTTVYSDFGGSLTRNGCKKLCGNTMVQSVPQACVAYSWSEGTVAGKQEMVQTCKLYSSATATGQADAHYFDSGLADSSEGCGFYGKY